MARVVTENDSETTLACLANAIHDNGRGFNGRSLLPLSKLFYIVGLPLEDLATLALII